jgi:hypothetical protein
MKYIIITAVLFSGKISSAQIIFNKVENEESKNTIIKLKDYLFSSNAPFYNINTTRGDTMTGVRDFYEKTIYQFFDSSKMEKRLRQMEKDNAMPYNQLKSYQYATLSGMANMLHCIPHDSIYAMGVNEYKRINQIEDIGYNKNTVFIGFVTKNNWNDFYFIEFDDTGKKIILMGPIIHFEELDNEATEFLDRHCRNFLKKSP